MIIAPVLQEVALRMSGGGTDLRSDPAAFAYVLRDAVQLARPDWIVTHHDLALESDAVSAEGIDPGDVIDVDLAATPLGAAAVELTATLRGVFSGGVIAASVTGPATMAGRIGNDDPGLIEDCGDVLAALAAAHAEAGADRVIVWEPEATPDPEQAHQPIVRRLALAGVECVLCHPAALDVGYTAELGAGAALLARDTFSSSEALIAGVARATLTAGNDGVLLSDGPVPGDCDMAALRQLGER